MRVFEVLRSVKVVRLSACIWLMALLVPIAAMAAGPSVADIRLSGTTYVMYDSKNRRIGSFPKVNGTLQCFSAGYYMLKSDSKYNLYNTRNRKQKSFEVSEIGEIVSMGVDTFTARNGAWLTTYDFDGRRLSSRLVR